MKSFLLLTLTLIIAFGGFSQVDVVHGPALSNDVDSKMNRLLQGDDDSFYSYRVRSKGKGTTFSVEKYSKSDLKLIFSKDVPVDEEEGKAKVEDVEYTSGKVFIFRRRYDKEGNKMSLYYQVVTKDGEVRSDLKTVVEVSSDHFEFVDFDVFPNPSKTKLLIKASHKANKTDVFKTDFILFDPIAEKIEFTKRVNRELFSNSNAKGSAVAAAAAIGGSLAASIVNKTMSEDIGFIGLMLDDQNNVYYGYTEGIEEGKDVSRYTLNVGVLNSNSDKPSEFELKFDKDYYVKDIEFSKSNNNEIVVGGFVKDVIERKGRDLVDVGVFSFTVDLTSNSVKSKALKIFDAKILTALESNPKKSRYLKYKLDYIMPIGSDVYYVGEQYREEMYVQSTGYVNTTNYKYEYMDVIIAKLNAAGEFEWVANAPLRNAVNLAGFPHVYKQYIAVPSNDKIYILTNTHPKNMKLFETGIYTPEDLKTVNVIHGSNFIHSTVDVKLGSVKTGLIFPNEEYCFAPIQERNKEFTPPSDCEIFVPGKNGELFIYTEDKGKDRFSKLMIK